MRRYLFLLWQFSQRDVASRYRGSALGGLWAVFSPVLLLTIYTFVFSVVFEARWGGQQDSKTDFALYLFIGMILHGFLAECLTRSTGVMLQHANYVKRVVFPLWVLPLVPVASAAFHALINTLVLVVAMWWLRGQLHWSGLLLPLAVMPVALTAIGMSWLLSGLGVFIRDLGQIMPMLTTILLFAAPVFYPVSALPPDYQQWMYLNPLTTPIELSRALLFDGQLPAASDYLGAYLAALAVLVLGAFVYKRLRKGFADAI